MAFTKYQVLLAVIMVISGTINTLTTNWADILSSKGENGVVHRFSHPFVQSAAMFMGEIICLLVFKGLFFYYYRKQNGSVETNSLVKGNRQFNPFVLFAPAICDCLATSIMYIGLTMTNPSSFQMLRGSVIIFVGLLSVAFLNRRLGCREWSAIFLITAGLIIVGLSDFITKSSKDKQDSNAIITGDLLIILAQIITAVQMVVEEKYIFSQDIPPLQAVGWEGIFGLLAVSALFVPFYHIPGGALFHNPRNVIEDLPDALIQISNNSHLVMAIVGTIISIALFNFAGISITKEISATTRMVLDSLRTIFVWGASLMLDYQDFHALQILGFAFLLTGMCVYNNIGVPQLESVIRNFPNRFNRYENVNEDGAVVNRSAEQPDTP